MGTQGEVVRVARLGPSGAWATETVSPPVPAAARLELVARPDGAVALAWETAGGEIHAVTGGDGWLPAARLSLPDQPSSCPSLSFGPGGELVCVWADGPTGIAGASGAGGAWSAPVAVGTGSGQVALPSVSGGNAAWVAAWARSGGGIESAALPAGGEWSGVETIGRREMDPFAPVVRGGANGDFLAGWVRSGGTVQVADRGGEGRWAPARDVGPVGEGASGMRLAVARDGAVSALWTRQGGRVALARRSPEGDWGEVLTVEEGAWGPRFAGHSSGWGVGTWHRAALVIGAMVVDPSAAPGAVWTLSREGERCRYPSGAIGSDGRAVVAWRRDDGAIQVARHETDSWSEPDDVCPAGGSVAPPRIACWDDGSAAVAWIGRVP